MRIRRRGSMGRRNGEMKGVAGIECLHFCVLTTLLHILLLFSLKVFRFVPRMLHLPPFTFYTSSDAQYTVYPTFSTSLFVVVLCKIGLACKTICQSLWIPRTAGIVETSKACPDPSGLLVVQNLRNLFYSAVGIAGCRRTIRQF